MHVGFTGTRRGMTAKQVEAVRDILDDRYMLHGFVAHHGDCIGADAQFHSICREPRGGPVTIVGHPGPTSRYSAGCEFNERFAPEPYMKRNRAIVHSSLVMIAAPGEDDPRARGGTWATIAIAREAHGPWRLHVVGVHGNLLDQAGWR